MRILVTGGAGYIGSELVRKLIRDKHNVICLDKFFFGEEPLQDISKNFNLTIIQEDIRFFNPSLLKNVDIVLDLAAISNDPSGELDPLKTIEINYKGRTRVARLCKDYGIKKYILASSCSVYGFHKAIVDENSDIDPLTTYAIANSKVEEEILLLSSKDFSVTVFRCATVYGLSKRMRFDLAINSIVLELFKNKTISVLRDGLQWRPFIHIDDVIEAYKTVIFSSLDKINGQIYNIGNTEHNFQILPLFKHIAESLDVEYRIIFYGDPDFRSYRVSFEKFKNDLKYKTQYTPIDGAKKIYKKLEEGDVKETLNTRTVQWYKHLIQNNCGP